MDLISVRGFLNHETILLTLDLMLFCQPLRLQPIVQHRPSIHRGPGQNRGALHQAYSHDRIPSLFRNPLHIL